MMRGRQRVMQAVGDNDAGSWSACRTDSPATEWACCALRIEVMGEECVELREVRPEGPAERCSADFLERKRLVRRRGIWQGQRRELGWRARTSSRCARVRPAAKDQLRVV